MSPSTQTGMENGTRLKFPCNIDGSDAKLSLERIRNLMQSLENFYCRTTMERLFQVAKKGDVAELHQLLVENPFILHQVSLMCAENPLHLSLAAGQWAFSREILKLKPEFTKEMNPDGYSPMHLASGNGQLEIVREMMRVDPKLCLLKGRDGKTPLHFAVIKGRVDVISEMLASCEGCIEDVTVQKETAFHLAVKNYQLVSLQVMFEWVRQKKKEDLLNKKDEHGNTILHVATWKKQRQVLELLLGNGPGTLEVNAVNESGLTALDLILIFPSEAGDREIQDILKGAGALKAQDCDLHITTHRLPDRDPTSNNPSHHLVNYFKFHEGRDSPSDVRTTLLVITVLVATATYQVGVSPPGGVWQDDQGHVAGTSIMGTNDVVSYILLVAFNSIGFSLSLSVIGILTSKFPLQKELQICLVALYSTYNTSVIALSPKSAKVFTIVFISVIPTAVPVTASFLRKIQRL